MNCPLCGAEYTYAEMACHSGCPFNKGCNILCCPHCGYEYIEESYIVNLFRKIFGKKQTDEIREARPLT